MYKANILIVIIFIIIKQILAQVCDKYCEVCNISTFVCEKCIDGYHFNSNINKCQSECQFGKYYYKEKNDCVSMCPPKYYNDDDSFTCRLFQSCPFLSEQGMQFFDEFTKSIVHQGYLVTSGKSYLKDDFTLKIFNATSGKYLGYMEGHDSEVLMLSVEQSTGFLLSISVNQMITWDLYYGMMNSIVYFGILDSNNLTLEQQLQYRSGKLLYQYYIDKQEQQLYIDDEIIILWQSIKQFGVLRYRQLKTSPRYTNSISFFNQFFKLFETVHSSAIIGFFKPKSSFLCSFSDKLIISWDLNNGTSISGGQGICSFNQEIINKVIQVNEKIYLIYFLNAIKFSIYNVSLNKCLQANNFPPDQNTIKFIEDVFIYDSQHSIIFVRTKQQILVYQILMDDQTDKNNVQYYFQLLNEVNQNNYFISFHPQPYFFLLQSNGFLKFQKITTSINSNSQIHDQNTLTFEDLGSTNFQFTQQMYITNIHYQDDCQSLILVGKELIITKIQKNADQLSQNQSNQILSSKNISPQSKGHRGKINGILIDTSNKNRIITYSNDGSFKIWEMQDDLQDVNNFASSISQGGYLYKGRIVIEQYHPSCNIIESSNCAWGVNSLQQVKDNLIFAQYSNNIITAWTYSQNSISLFYTFTLSDQSIDIINFYFHRILETITICNSQQMSIFDMSGNLIYTKSDTLIRAYFYRCDSTCLNRDAVVLIAARGVRTEMSWQYFNFTTKVIEPTTFRSRNYKNTFVYGEIFSNDLIILSTGNNLLYGHQYNSQFDLQANLVSLATYFSYDVYSQKTIVILKTGQFQFLYPFKNAGAKNFTSNPAPLKSISLASNPLIVFFFQNNVYYPTNNQILGINEQLEVAFFISFQEPISTLQVDSISRKLYIGFQSGKIYHGPFLNQPLNYREVSQNFTSPQYYPSLKSLFFNRKVSITKKDIFSNSNYIFNSNKLQHKQIIEGYLIDEINKQLITYSKEQTTCLYKWDLDNNSNFVQISDNTMLGTAKAFLDISGDYLLSFTDYWVSITNYTYNIVVWKYSSLQKQYTNSDHTTIFENLKKDEPAETVNTMVYGIKQYLFMPKNSTLLTINIFNGINIYFYKENKSRYFQITNTTTLNKIYYDELNNYLYAKIVDILTQWVEVYDIFFNFKLKKQVHSYDLKDILFVEDKTISYDISTICVMDRKNLTTLTLISSEYPKVTNLIISVKLNMAIVWNNNVTEEIQSNRIGIYNLNTGKSIYDLYPIQPLEVGLSNLVYLEESTCQLYLTRTSGFLYSFDVCNLFNSGYYALGYVNQNDILYIPEFNYVVTTNSNNLSIMKVESSISSRQKFVQLYQSKNKNYIKNRKEGTTYYIDFDNSVWKIYNDNYRFEYMQKLQEVIFTKQFNDQFFVQTDRSLIQFSNSLDIIKQINVITVNLYFSSQYIFFQDQGYNFKKIFISNFTISDNFIINFTDYVQNTFIFEDLKEIVVYSPTSYYRYNYITDKLLYTDQLTKFSFSFYSYQLKILLHISSNTDISLYNNFIPDQTSLSSARSFNFITTSLQTLKVLNLLMDDDNKNLIAQYSDYVIRVFKINMDSNQIIQSITLIKQIASPSITNILKLRIRNQYIQLYLPWQVIEYDRSTLDLKNNFNSSQTIKNTDEYQISAQVPNFFFASSSDYLSMIDIAKSQIIFKFPLIFPQLIDLDIQTFKEYYSVELKGVSNGIFFKYNFFIPINNDQNKQDSSLSECYFDVGQIEKYYNQKNSINILKNTLTQLNINLKTTLLMINPTLTIFYLEEMDIYNSKMLFTGTDEGNQQRTLYLQFDTFSVEKFKEIQLKNYQINITYCSFVTFHKRTQKVVFQDIRFLGIGNSTTLEFRDMNYVIFENVVIDQLSLTNKSNLFQFVNCTNVYIKNIKINGVKFSDYSQLLMFNSIKNLNIENVFLSDITIHQGQNLIKIMNVQNGLLQNSFLQEIKLSQTIEYVFIIDLQGNSIFKIQNFTYINSEEISLLTSKNSYEQNLKYYFRSRDNLILSQLKVSNIKSLTISLIKSVGYKISVIDSQFSNIYCKECIGGVANFNEITDLSIKNSSFINNHATKGACIAIIDGKYNQTNISFSNFTDNRAESCGGAIYLQQSDLFLEQNIITNNNALIGGGIRYIGIQPDFVTKIFQDSKMKELNTIKDNVAQIHSQNYGSYVFQASLKTNADLKEIQLTKIQVQTRNSEVDKSKLILKEYIIDEFQSGGLVDFRFQILDTENNPINFSLEMIKDRKYPKDILEEIEQFKIKANIDNNDIKIYGQYITSYQQFNSEDKSFSINEMQIVSTPLTGNSILIEFPAIKRVIDSTQQFYDGKFIYVLNKCYLKIIIYFKFKQKKMRLRRDLCSKQQSLSLWRVQTWILFLIIAIERSKQNHKESYSIILIQQIILSILFEAKRLVYQIVNSFFQQKNFKLKEQANIQTCSRCPSEATECHRNFIKLSEGYWRINNQTDNIIKCSNNPKNCNGDEATGYCKQGHYGPLCEQCDMKGEIWGGKYVTDGKYNCVNCAILQTNFKYMLPSVIVGICMIIYMVISIRIALEISELIVLGYYLRKMNLVSISKSAFIDTTNMNMKAMMSYMQIAQLVNTFEVDLPGFLKILPEYIGEPVNNFMYTLDCYLNQLASESVPVVYLRTIWSLTMPFLYMIGMGIIYLILILLRFTKPSKSIIISGLIFLIFFLQPSMISHLLKVMSCRKIDQLKYVLADVTQSCYTQNHVLYIFYICIPGLLLWGFIIPLFFMKKLYTYRNQLDNALIRLPYGFLYQDYKYNMYYWEFIKSYLKISIVVIHNFYGDPYSNLNSF